MKTFMKNWNGRAVEDNGCYMSKEAKSFVTAMKNMLKRKLTPYGINVLSLKPNHYDCSGFLEKDGYYVYISYSIPRMVTESIFQHQVQAMVFFTERQRTKKILLADTIISVHWKTCQTSFISSLIQELSEIRSQALEWATISSAQTSMTAIRMNMKCSSVQLMRLKIMDSFSMVLILLMVTARKPAW